MITAKKCVQIFASAVLLIAMTIPSGFAAGAKTAKGNDDVSPLYVDFKHIVVPIIHENGRTGMVAINLMAEVKNQDAQLIVTNHLPRLRDAFIRSLYGSIDGQEFRAQNGNLDVDRIKTRLMHTVNLVLKDQQHSIKDILFQNITQQSY